MKTDQKETILQERTPTYYFFFFKGKNGAGWVGGAYNSISGLRISISESSLKKKRMSHLTVYSQTPMFILKLTN